MNYKKSAVITTIIVIGIFLINLFPAMGKTASELTDKGIILLSKGKTQEALKCYDEAIKLDPNCADAWANKGYLLSSEKKYEEALQCFTRALRIDPSNTIAQKGKESTQQMKEKSEEANIANITNSIDNFNFIFGIIGYIYYSYCLMLIARKTGAGCEWLAWIPGFNFILLFIIAEKPIWWILGFLVPILNLILLIIICMEIAGRCGRSPIIGIGLIVPLASFIVIGYLAFGGGGMVRHRSLLG